MRKTSRSVSFLLCLLLNIWKQEGPGKVSRTAEIAKPNGFLYNMRIERSHDYGAY